MGSKTSKAKRSTTFETKTVVTSAPKVSVGFTIPQEIVDEILDHLVVDSDSRPIRSCSLVSKSWVQRCRRYLFHTILFTSTHTTRWLNAFPVPEESPAHHVRDLRFFSGGDFNIPEEFFEHIPWFTSVEKVSLSGYGGWETFCRILSLGRFSQSVTSLVISAGGINVLQIRNILAQLPSLEGLSLSGFLVMMNRDTLRGIGSVLTGNFGGRLRLLKRHAVEDVINMLLEIPTGLHFTEVDILSTCECLVLTVRLAEACGGNLVKLTYSVDNFHGEESFDQSFDFSKFPNLREVSLGLRWIHGGPRWIPMALSTVNAATSPQLSVMHLNFIGPPGGVRVLGLSIESLGNDLQRTTDEVTRIRHEFDEAIEIVVFRDQWFKVLLDSLHLRV